MSEYIETVVIGGGQAGLSTGYHLAKHDRPFVILDAEERVGDVWRRRWDSLRLFTPARFDGLPGTPFPGDPWTYPTKDEFADYLEGYAASQKLPVRSGVRVDSLSSDGERYLISAGPHRFEADNVVIAMAGYQRPLRPDLADGLAPDTVQLHSSEYRNPGQMRDGDVLLVGAGNSGAEVALDLADDHHVLMAGRDPGHLPFRIDSAAGRMLTPVVLRFLFHRVLTVRTPLGRRVRPSVISHGGPLIRVKPHDLARAGVASVPKVTGVRDGLPELADGRVLDVANVVWCTGYDPGFSWIDLPVLGENEPRHHAGIVDDHPGLYFVGLHFLYAMSSAMIHGSARDAQRVVDHLVARTAPATARAAPVASARRPG